MDFGNFSLLDRLEACARLAKFLNESLTGAREMPYSDSALCGAMYVFWALEKELMFIRDSMTK